MNRLTGLETLRIDPERPLAFSYRGKQLTGYRGDTVAGAMFAAGVRIFSRSLKYHRPRGLYSLDGESSNTLMAVDGFPNHAAERTYLTEGMHVEPQNFSGSPEKDRLGILDRLDPLMPAGFYYRVFHRPYKYWPMFAGRIRKAAGVGSVDTCREWHKGRRSEIFLNAEVCVLGGGPAGMAAARAAAEAGLRVILLESRPWLGGFYEWRNAVGPESEVLSQRARRLEAGLEGLDNLRVFKRAYVTGLYGDNQVTAFQEGGPELDYDERHLEVRARTVVVALGCIERPLIFEHNERPGVMQAACAHRLARTWGILPGRRAVFAVGHDYGLEAALDLASLGVSVARVCDTRPTGAAAPLVQALEEAGIAYTPGWTALRALGKPTVEGVELIRLDGRDKAKEACDLVVASAGFTPLNGPVMQAGARPVFDPHTAMFLPDRMPERVFSAGRLEGLGDPAAIEASGRAAGLAAALACGAEVAGELEAARQVLAISPGPEPGSTLAIPPGLGKGRKAFICFDEDGSVKGARQSATQGFDVPELTKRFGGFGLGPGQSGVPGHNLPLVMSEITGSTPEATLPTTPRAPFVGVSLATLAGPGHDIAKETPLHQSQLALGGIMRRVGVWQRARYFSTDFTSREEILNVRNNVGLIDVSTLGKFRLHGPDALKALQRVYISNMSKIEDGKLKYSAMCNEDGCLIDDGVVARLGEDDYYFTTSTGRAGETIAWFRYHARYEGWDFALVNLTDGMGAINLAGPKAREVLSQVTEADVSNEAFPFMAWRDLSIGEGVTARVMRLGFVGELSYELHVPSSYTQYVWDLLMEAGSEFGIAPFGLEAQSVLRAEKGHVIIGAESEGRTNLLDLGLGFLWASRDLESGKVGSPALRFSQHQPGRLKLVGFTADNTEALPPDGTLVVAGNDIMGHVCTARYSPGEERAFGMALVHDSLTTEGTTLQLYQNDGQGERRMTATVTPTPFYDPQGLRLRM